MEVERIEDRKVSNIGMNNKREKEDKRIRISDLDLKILEFIADMKFVNADIVGEKFFRGKAKRYPQKRLRDYVRHDLVFSVLEWGGRKFNYLVSESGTKLLQRKGFDIVAFTRKGIDLKNYEHDKILTELRVKLEQQEIVKEWTSERLIRSREDYLKVSDEEKIIADGYCVSVEHGNKLIIEFENSRKSNTRIKKLLLNYQKYLLSSKEQGEKVLFFFASKSLLASYKKFYQEGGFSFEVSFIEISDLGITKTVPDYMRASYV